MKAFALILALLMVIGLLCAGWMFLTAGITVESVAVAATEAEAQQATFDLLKEQLADSRVLGTRFRPAELTDAEEYVFYTYTIQLKNSGFVTADMVELQVTPMPDDILQIGDTTIRSLAPGKNGSFSATILTERNTHSIREIGITFHIWGLPFTMKTTSR